MKKNITAVFIPGAMYAEYQDGAITSLKFMPHGSDAGYTGPAAVILEGDERLDVEDSAMPFWRGVQTFLQAEQKIEWEE